MSGLGVCEGMEKTMESTRVFWVEGLEGLGGLEVHMEISMSMLLRLQDLGGCEGMERTLKLVHC